MKKWKCEKQMVTVVENDYCCKQLKWENTCDYSDETEQNKRPIYRQ